MKYLVYTILIMKILSFTLSASHRVNNAIKRHWRIPARQLLSSSSSIPPSPPSMSNTDGDNEYNNNMPNTGDILLSGLNEDQDISVKIVSCREIVQESMIKNNLQIFPAKALGELITCTLMMGSGLKNNESLQINLVGKSGLRNIMAITDSDLKVRGMVGNNIKIPGNASDALSPATLLGGGGEIQVVRNHPSYKTPTNGIVSLRDTSVAINLAFYMAESEQRTAAMLTDVKIDGYLCRNALGILVETLPGANPDNVEKCITNLNAIQAKGLRSYLIRNENEKVLHFKSFNQNLDQLDQNNDQIDQNEDQNGMFRDFESCLQRVLDDCLLDLGQSISWTKTPYYACICSDEKIWRILRLMPKNEVVELIETQNNVECKCEFCGKMYVIPKEQIEARIINPPPLVD